MSYADFLARKAQANDGNGFEPLWMPDYLFGFQRELTTWALRMGRAALFEDCGLGKTPQFLVWAQNVYEYTGKPVLVLTPLAVSFQAKQEAAKFGIDAEVSRDGSIPAALTITNYERLEHFEPEDFGGVVCDESSVLKGFDSRRRAQITEFLRRMPYRLLATATAAPNDYIELGTSSEALGHLGHMDMLNRFFTNKLNNSSTGRYRGQGPEWRFKGHAEERFWQWVCSWARAVRKPSDLGYDDGEFVLPPLYEDEHYADPRTPPPDRLFDVEARGLQEEREETRRTISERCEMAAHLLSDAETAIAWCNLNNESAELARQVDGAVEVRGSDSLASKEEKLMAFTNGDIRVLVSKPSVSGHGMNWQHCNRVSYFPNHSYESMYQAIRRCYRFGQKNPVRVDYVSTPGGKATLKNLKRKAAQADRMFEALTAHMREAQSIRRDDTHNNEMEAPSWLAS